MAARYQTPYCLAMLIADMIYIDPATGKRSIMGCFSAIQATDFPLVWPMMAVHVSLTDGRGDVPISFRVVDADEETVVFQSEQNTLNFIDPRGIVDIALVLQNATFPVAGEYRLQLRAEEEVIMERRLLLIKIETPPSMGPLP